MHHGKDRSLVDPKTKNLVIAFVGILATAALTSQAAVHAATWDHAHGDAANSGFVDVGTAASFQPSAKVSGLGTFAPGAGPVVGPDGTVYVGNREGVLWALHADGGIYWNEPLGAGQSILASPVIDSDGTIYVVGERTYTDHRVRPAVKRTDSTLFHIHPTGGRLWSVPFPEHFTGTPQAASRGATTAPPNIWRSGTSAAVIVPAVYKVLGGGEDLYLLAFSPGGSLLRQQEVTYRGQVVSGDAGGFSDAFGCIISFCYLFPGFSPTPPNFYPDDLLPTPVSAPMPGVGIFTFAGGGVPWVIVNDPWEQTIGYTFTLDGGFTEMFRDTDRGRIAATSPMELPDGHSVTAASYGSGHYLDDGHLTFSGPNGMALPAVHYFYPLLATPARTADQRLVVVSDIGTVSVLRDASLLTSVDLGAETIAPPAVSRNYIYVSTASSLRTLNILTMTQAGEYSWSKGGLSAPAIGPSGSLYALADNVLYVFPAPRRRPCYICNPSPPVGVIHPRLNPP